jgi:glycosyltransferase involved in cell wall biosynthesis
MASAKLTSPSSTQEQSLEPHVSEPLLLEPVLHVLWSLEIGGAERALFQLVREQRRRGRNADVLVGSHAGFYGERTREVGASVFELHQRSALDAKAAAALTRIQNDYAIVHFHGAEPLLMRAASRRPDTRLFYTHRSGNSRYLIRQRSRYRFVAHYVRRRFAGVSGNTVQGARAAASLFRLPPETVPVTYNGIDFSLLTPRRSRSEVLDELGQADLDVVRVGTSANLRDWKRVDRLLHGIASLRHEPIRCLVIGDGPSRPALERLASDLEIAHLVTFIGMREHVGDYLQTLDMFALPSGPEESFGNSVVEAMGVGLPVLVFADGGGLVEHVEHGRTGFVARDQDDFVRALRDLVEDEQMRREVGARASAVVTSKYTLEAMLDSYDALYRMGPLVGTVGA